MRELAMVGWRAGFNYGNADASFTGPGRTPWNTDFWSGGSSSGSAAAVSARLVSFVGSETSGSIITPSTFCGIAGMRPTYGRVSRHGAMALCWTLDKLGRWPASADCCGLILSAISGHDPLDVSNCQQSRSIIPNRNATQTKVPRRRAETRRQRSDRELKQSLKVLEKFCDLVEDVELPKLPFRSDHRHDRSAEGASRFSRPPR